MTRRAIVTPAALELVAKMVEQGVRAADIANEIGCTLGTLRVRCSQSKISLRPVRFTKREGDRADYPHSCEAVSASYHTGRRLSLWLPEEALIQLDEWAAMHGMSKTSLVAKLLVAIARDGLVAAVLDEPVSEESAATLRRSRVFSSRS
jgi:hypothetical protein